MAVKLKKRAFFLLSIMFTGVLGLWNTYFRTNNTDGSLIASIALADTPPVCSSCGCAWTESQCTIYYSGGDGGSDSGGCCADASAGGGCGCGGS